MCHRTFFWLGGVSPIESLHAVYGTWEGGGGENLAHRAASPGGCCDAGERHETCRICEHRQKTGCETQGTSPGVCGSLEGSVIKNVRKVVVVRRQVRKEHLRQTRIDRRQHSGSRHGQTAIAPVVLLGVGVLTS